jgi:hypothetical protein
MSSKNFVNKSFLSGFSLETVFGTRSWESKVPRRNSLYKMEFCSCTLLARQFQLIYSENNSENLYAFVKYIGFLLYWQRLMLYYKVVTDYIRCNICRGIYGFNAGQGEKL